MSTTSAVPAQTRVVRLAARPHGKPQPENFEVATDAVARPGDGQILVRNTLMSVDPYMRGRMNDAKSYVAPFEIGRPLDGGAIGEVVESRAAGFTEGDTVLHGLGWREYATLDAAAARTVDPDVAPLGAYLGVLGMPGLTAYAGLTEVAGMKQGDAVFVSAASGAVGSIVGQIARLRGASRVIGSAGSDEKVRFLTDELGFDAAFNYKDGPVAQQLAEAAGNGIDVYFDNVGGDHLEAAIAAANVHARMTVCGMVSMYNATEPAPAPKNLAQLVGKRIQITGMLVADHEHLRDQFIAEVGPKVADGTIRYRETTVDGIDAAPQAFIDLLDGAKIGKMLVRLS